MFRSLSNLFDILSPPKAHPKRRAGSNRVRMKVECLEHRIVCSATTVIPSLVAQPSIAQAAPLAAATDHTDPYQPLEIESAYGIKPLRSSKGLDGAGQTIAIVDAFDDPNLVNTGSANYNSSDLAVFDHEFGIPDPPSFRKVDLSGGMPDPGDSSDPINHPKGGWELEEALDVEWAHAIAPKANIVLVEARSPDDLKRAVEAATQQPGVSVVSMSWGLGDLSMYGDEFDPLFSTFTARGITFVASSGDDSAPQYPALSPNVLAVGGTSLIRAANGGYYDTAWSGSGGGPSAFEPAAPYQSAITGLSHRTAPDVAYDGDPNTGVYIYDSFEHDPALSAVGGTSAGAPQWAALIALVNQSRQRLGSGPLTNAVKDIYGVPASDFRDITSGGNATWQAGPGYDLVTGRGAPWAPSLVPDLTYAEPIIRYVPPPGGFTGGISGGGVSGGGVSAVALAIATGQSKTPAPLSDADGMTMQVLATPPVFTLPPASQSASPPTTATATDDSLPHLWPEARNVAQAKALVDCLSDWADLGSSIYY